MKILASLLLALLVGCSSQPKFLPAMQFKKPYIVRCIAQNGVKFIVTDAISAEIHREGAHYLEVEVDNGTIYHYITDGESCGIQAQDAQSTQ